MSSTTIKRVSYTFSEDEIRYILNSLSEFKSHRKQKVEEDEDCENDITPMYADDIMQARLIHEKISVKAISEFGEDIALPLSYETL